MIDVGQICIKIAGRDAGKTCVVIEKIDNTYVMIDGQTRRKKCNIMHLEPVGTALKIKKGASHAEVAKEFSKLKIEMRETKAKKKADRPKTARSAKKTSASGEEKEPAGKMKSAKPAPAQKKEAKPAEKEKGQKK